MSPSETWSLLLLCFVILYAAFYGGGKIIDWLLDRLWGRSQRDLDGVYRRDKAMGVMESWTKGKE